jgi:formylglycine-generating enzyme
MGSPWCEPFRARSTEDPVQVTLTHPFRIQRAEMTRAQWRDLGFDFVPLDRPETVGPPCTDDGCPVTGVNWFSALLAANAMSRSDGLPECYQLTGCTNPVPATRLRCDRVDVEGSLYDCAGYRLPTLAEWEYATRAGTRTAFYNGSPREPERVDCKDDPLLSQVAWYCGNTDRLRPVRLLAPNGWGLYDTQGNAGEWVNDARGPGGYGTGPHVDYGSTLAPLAPGDARYVRGGFHTLSAAIMRIAGGIKAPPDTPGDGTTVRLVRTLK